MTDERAFLDALKANPADDTTRLVYADWLDERGEAVKAEYLRHVVDLVLHRPGCPEYTHAACELVAVSLGLDLDWRSTVGGRFDLVLEGYAPDRKIHTIKVVREITGFGLAEAKAIAESVPTPLFSWAPFERVFPHLLGFAGVNGRLPDEPAAVRACIRPTQWPAATGLETVFDIVLARLDFDRQDRVGLGEYARQHLTTRVAAILGVEPADAAARLERLPLTIATGIRPAAVAETVRDLLLRLNVSGVIPPGGLQIVPRNPTS